MYGRYFVLSLVGDAKVRQASRILVLLVVLLVIERALGRARLAIHNRARLLLSRWRGLRTCLTGTGSTVAAIMIIKKHHNGSIFGEPARQLYALLLRYSLFLPHLFRHPRPLSVLFLLSSCLFLFLSAHLISRPTLVKNAREYKELHY